MKELTFRKGEEIKIGKEEDLKANWIQTSRKITTLFHSERQKWHFVFFLAFGFCIPIPNFLAKCENLPHLTNISYSYSFGK